MRNNITFLFRLAISNAIRSNAKSEPHRFHCLLIFSVLYAIPSLCTQASPTNEPPQSLDRRGDLEIPAQLNKAERDFLNAAAAIIVDQIAMGELASTRGSTEIIKSFGLQLVDLERISNDRLQSLARRNVVILSPIVSPKKAARLSNLRYLKDKEFDAVFTEEMEEDYEDAILFFDNGIRLVNPELVYFSTSMSLVMQYEHETLVLPRQ